MDTDRFTEADEQRRGDLVFGWLAGIPCGLVAAALIDYWVRTGPPCW